MIVELHLIQNVAPSNLNRDDQGNPKDTTFGDARRARLSSQALKSAMRSAPEFAAAVQVELALRTRWVVDRVIVPLLVQQHGREQDQATAVAQEFVAAYFGKMGEGTRSAAAVFVSPAEARRIAQALVSEWDALITADTQVPTIKRLAKELTQESVGWTSAPDLALFGRMLAAHPELSLPGAASVANAIATHRTTLELDFYTAADGLATPAETGAAMADLVGYNSACFYRYSLVDWDQLAKNLRGDLDLARRTLRGFLQASVAALPGGKQHAFAAYNPPSLILAVVRQGAAWSMANAFERPVTSRGNSGLVGPSITALDTYWGRLAKMYGTAQVRRTFVVTDSPEQLANLKDAQVETFDALVRGVLDSLSGGEEATS